MTAGPLLIGAEVGTTNIKVVAFDRSGRAAVHASTPTPTHYPRPGRAHYDPEELWHVFAATLRKVTGWLDRTFGRDHLFGVTGLSLQPIFGLCKLLWLKENEPEAFGRTAAWLNVADYIAFRLAGVAATDYSLASRTLALDLHRLRWAEDLLQEADVSPDLFAPLRPSGSSLGPITSEAAEATRLPESAQVAVGGHDHVCGALATGVTEPGTMLNSLGTAEAIFLPLERPLTDPEVGHQGYTQGAHVAGQYYVFGGQYTSGA